METFPLKETPKTGREMHRSWLKRHGKLAQVGIELGGILAGQGLLRMLDPGMETMPKVLILAASLGLAKMYHDGILQKFSQEAGGLLKDLWTSNQE